MDNQLSPELRFPTNKLERLARECTHQNLKLPCKPGQKWYCQHEHGRWRKHKCKSQITFPKQKSYRKCACFSAEKLVYKKLPVSFHRIKLIFFNKFSHFSMKILRLKETKDFYVRNGI